MRKAFNKTIRIPLEIHVDGIKDEEDILHFNSVTVHGGPAPNWLIGLLEEEYALDVIDEAIE